jgi:hypothetical protein
MNTADTTTKPVEGAQPAQQQQAPVTTNTTAEDQAQAEDKRIPVTLGVREVIEQMSQFGDSPGEYKPESPIQGKYWRFKYGGAIVICPEAFKKAFDEGTVTSVRFTPTTYLRTVPDPNNAGQNKQVIGYGWSFDSFGTIEKLEKAQDTMKKVAAINMGIKIQEAKTEAAIASITPENIKEIMGEAGLKQLLAGV